MIGGMTFSDVIANVIATPFFAGSTVLILFANVCK